MGELLVESPASHRSFRVERYEADFVIVGGGMSGTCCAINAARAGISVVLIQDRPVLGGNASSEVRLWIQSAVSHGAMNNRWAREGGVIDEIIVENTFRNPEGNPVLFDTILLEKVADEPNITLLLDTAVNEVEKNGEQIAAVRGFCSLNQTIYEVHAPLFCDASGDGALGFLAGAAFRVGAESRDEFNEPFAPTEEFGSLLGHSIYFYSKDVGYPVKFVPPNFAIKDVKKRIPRYRHLTTTTHGVQLWWIEYGGRLNTIHDTELIKWELWKIVYGVWDYLKNSGDFPDAETLTLEWVGLIPGRRESRRFEGHYMLRQQDVVNQVEHDDGVAYGGWGIDLHPADGVFSEFNGANILWLPGIYQIPYRCLISRNIPNLFLAGRLISASHVAFGTTRQMATGAHMGQAVGIAAALCTRQGLEPKHLLASDLMSELRRELLKTGQHIPGVRLDDPSDLVQQADITASSEFVLDEFPADGGCINLDKSRAQLMPAPPGRLPSVTYTVDVAAPTRLRCEVRTSNRADSHTPCVTLDAIEIDVSPGQRQQVKLEPDSKIDEPRYVYYCLMKNDDVSVHTTSKKLTGLLAVGHNGTQEADENVGMPYVEFWAHEGAHTGAPDQRSWDYNLAFSVDPPLKSFSPRNVANGFARPTSEPNAWVAAAADDLPSIQLRWDETKRIKLVELSFDTNSDRHLESVLVHHPEHAMPACVHHYRIRVDGEVVAEVEDNHQTRRSHQFDPPLHTDGVAIELVSCHGAQPAALFDVRCYE